MVVRALRTMCLALALVACSAPSALPLGSPPPVAPASVTTDVDATRAPDRLSSSAGETESTARERTAKEARLRHVLLLWLIAAQPGR